MNLPLTPSPIIQLHSDLFESKQIAVFVKRDDLIHPEIMGNKWRKLKYNLEEAKKKDKNTLITFGGAYSNHIAAVSAAGKTFGFKSIGIIRGDELSINANATLIKAHENGMELRFIDRLTYRKWSKGGYPHLKNNEYLLPEGGTNQLAIPGVEELIKEVSIDYDIITVPIGTGGTFAGVLKGVENNKQVWGFSSLKGKFVHGEIEKLLIENEIDRRSYSIFTNYHFGGYAKYNQELMQFIHTFKQEFGFSLDPIYTGKMFFGVWDKIKNDEIAVQSKILLIHTGGLQGIAGFNGRFSSLEMDPKV